MVAGDAGALDLIREFHPRFAEVTSSSPPVSFKLADAQMAIARLYGQSSWSRLREQLGLLDAHTRPDPADVDEGSDLPSRFVALACVSYNGDHDPGERIAQAQALHRRDPGLAGASIAALAVAGDHRQLAERIAQDPSLVNTPCGPNLWPPLLYCCFSRLDLDATTRSTVRTARLLLDAGADPNAGFLWRGLVPPFTALTGAFGRGEADQPPHPAAFELARALLEAGADPNDGQALYNNGLAGTAVDDPGHLVLLVEFGLGIDRNGPWYQRFGRRLTSPAELLYDELEVAAHRNLPNRMRFLVDLGLDLERPVGRSRRTPRELAEDAGNVDVLAVLAAAGVTGPDAPR
ncbi:MAG: hypothetical protein AB7Q92_26570 [Acidimicrobiia bacterium]